jgi:hypothetical protein
MGATGGEGKTRKMEGKRCCFSSILSLFEVLKL